MKPNKLIRVVLRLSGYGWGVINISSGAAFGTTDEMIYIYKKI